MESKGKKAALKMIFQLSCNDIKTRYSNSIFGILWAFVMPLVTILVFWYVFQLGFKNLPVDDAPYILWFSAAYVPWIFFVDITTAGCNSLVEYSFLVKKIRFNVEYIPLIKTISALFVHVFFIAFVYVMYLVYGFRPSVYNVQMLYYSLAAAIFGLGLVWLLSALTVFFKDLNSLYNLLIQIGFWVTPILWNEETMVDPVVKAVLRVNPMHYVVNGYRNSLLSKKWFWENPQESLLFWGITAFIWIAGVLIFKKLKPFLADEV